MLALVFIPKATLKNTFPGVFFPRGQLKTALITPVMNPNIRSTFRLSDSCPPPSLVQNNEAALRRGGDGANISTSLQKHGANVVMELLYYLLLAESAIKGNHSGK